jgi:antitoxin component YwqK of YwqJK toxin-antitoxin module
MKKILSLLFLILLCGCLSKTTDQSNSIVSMQIIDRNGFTETISNKDRLTSYQTMDFTHPQPYQKVLRVYGRDLAGKSHSRITSYHDNGQLWQYLEVTDGRANGLYQEWFSNGHLKIEAHVVEGVADIHDLAQATWVFEGECKVWDEQSRLIGEFFYEKGLLHTPARYYFPNGILQKLIPYVQGEIHGVVQIFDHQGKIIEETPYVNGERHGEAYAYWVPGQLLSQEVFDHGRLLKAIYYDPAGNPVAEIKEGNGKVAQFKEGTLHMLVSYIGGFPEGEIQVFYPNGSLHVSYVMKEGKKNGEEWEYYLSEPGKTLIPKLCLHWHEDQIKGQVKTWYPNGQIESQREVNGNKKQGVCFAWYKNGDLMLVEEYENDLLIKGTYYKKGDKKAVSRIDSGKGLATLYTNEGLFLKKVSYEKGKPTFNDESLQ